MASTNNAAVCPPDAIQVLQLFMNDSLGLPDPAACIFEAMMEDPDRELLGEFMHAWQDCFGHAPMSVKDAIGLFKSSDTLREIIGDIAGERDGTYQS